MTKPPEQSVEEFLEDCENQIYYSDTNQLLDWHCSRLLRLVRRYREDLKWIAENNLYSTTSLLAEISLNKFTGLETEGRGSEQNER